MGLIEGIEDGDGMKRHLAFLKLQIDSFRKAISENERSKIIERYTFHFIFSNIEMQQSNMGDVLTIFYRLLTIRRVFFLLSVIKNKACQLRFAS